MKSTLLCTINVVGIGANGGSVIDITCGEYLFLKLSTCSDFQVIKLFRTIFVCELETTNQNTVSNSKLCVLLNIFFYRNLALERLMPMKSDIVCPSVQNNEVCLCLLPFFILQPRFFVK